MNIKFLIPGKCREEYINKGVEEYLKRLSKYAKVSVNYLAEEPLPKNPTSLQIDKALKLEAERALKIIKSDEIVFLIDIHNFDSIFELHFLALNFVDKFAYIKDY